MRSRRAAPWLLNLLVLGALCTTPSCGFEWDKYDCRLADGCSPGEDGCLCEPDTISDCYEGPEGTKDVGACRSGAHRCDASGSRYDECIGQITPGSEDCATPEDDNCDGEVNEHCAAFSAAYGDGEPYGIAVAPGGGPILVGATGTGTLGFGGAPLGPPTGEGPQAFAAKLDANLGHVWSGSYGGPNEQIARGVAADARGDVVVVGSFKEQIAFGATVLTAAGAEPDAFVARLAGDGSVAWAKGFGDAGAQEATSVVIGSSGDVIVAGTFTGAVNLGGSDLPANGASDVLLAKLGADGAHVWSERFGDAGAQRGDRLAADRANNAVVLAGSFEGELDFGSGSPLAADGADAYVARFDGAGQPLASRSWPSPGAQAATAVAVDADGFVYVVGTFTTSIDLGDGAVPSKGKNDIFVAKLTPALTPLWHKTFGDVEDDVVHDVALDDQGNVVFVATFRGAIDFGGGALAAKGLDIALCEMAPDGGYVFSRRFGNLSSQGKHFALATDDSAQLYLTGRFAGSIDFGAGVLVPEGGEEGLFLARFAH